MTADSNPRQGDTTAHRTGGVQKLLDVLGDGLDELSDEQLEFAPITEVFSEIDRLGVCDSHSYSPAPQAGVDALRAAYANVVPSVPRSHFVWRLRSALDEQRAFVLRGSAGTGKTFLVRQLLPAACRDWRRFRRSIFLDCTSLRMKNPVQFEKAALRQVLGNDEVLSRRFISQLEGEECEAPFSSFLEKRGAGALLVVDQAEHLDRTGAIGNWISNCLLPIAEKRRLSVLFCVRTPASDKGIKELKALPYFELRSFDTDEVSEWLSESYFNGRNDGSITADRILRITGGCPRLVRDYVNYARDRLLDSATLLEFARWRPGQFMSDCERFLWAARSFPDVLTGGLDILSDAKGNVLQNAMFTEVRNALIATGVVESAGRIGLRFSSPIHHKRISTIMADGAFKLLACRAKFSHLDRSGGIRALLKSSEIAPDVIADCIAAEGSPTDALRRFQEVIWRWGMDAKLMLRDPDNAKLWVCSDRVGGTKKGGRESSNFLSLQSPSQPIDGFCEKWIVSAVNEGRVTVSDDDEVFIPVVGVSGRIELVVHGFLLSKQNPHRHAITVDRIVSLVRGLRRTLMNISMSFWMQRQSRVENKLLYRNKGGGPALRWQSFVRSLADTGPAAIIVLERAPQSWFVSKFEAFSRDGMPPIDRKAVEAWNTQRLDKVANHPSGHGLVIGGREVVGLFPNIERDDTAVYLRPVWVGNREACRIVAFVFQGAVIGRLDGHVQHRLSVMAPEVIALAS